MLHLELDEGSTSTNIKTYSPLQDKTNKTLHNITLSQKYSINICYFIRSLSCLIVVHIKQK